MKNQSIDIWLLTSVLILAGIGLVMVYSSSMYLSMNEDGSGSFYIKKQAIRLMIGLFMMMFLTKVNYRGYSKIAPILLVVGFILLVMLLVKKHVTGDVERWLRIGGVGFQPSEFMKIFLIMYLASAISGMGDKIREFTKGFLPLLAIIGITFVLVVLQPDLGISGLILVTGLYILFIGHAKLSHILLVTIPAVFSVIFIVNTVPYMKQRWDVFMHPENNPDAAWQITQSVIGIGSGGMFGVGLGNSRQKFLFLPESHTDFVFSIFAEELGFVGTVTMMVLLFVLIYRGFAIARQAPDMFGFLLASGISTMIGFQTFINIGVTTALLPTTGMTLPFISYGGSSLLLLFCSIGILLNISKQGCYERRLSQEFGIRLHRRAMA
ncbi:MAG: putative lipid II flippase FtsW [Candidatus Latescibacteria bacterium]|nr:putative lipid II flippase FtsW [Candidatus Latescibacterota bacterium]